MKELIRKFGEYINNHQTTGIEETLYYILCEIVYGK